MFNPVTRTHTHTYTQRPGSRCWGCRLVFNPIVWSKAQVITPCSTQTPPSLQSFWLFSTLRCRPHYPNCCSAVFRSRGRELNMSIIPGKTVRFSFPCEYCQKEHFTSSDLGTLCYVFKPFCTCNANINAHIVICALLRKHVVSRVASMY